MMVLPKLMYVMLLFSSLICKVRMWIDAQEPNPILMQKSEHWQPGVYVKVVGYIRYDFVQLFN
jgi:hypothetical protein